jgi:hypothetical protein
MWDTVRVSNLVLNVWRSHASFIALNTCNLSTAIEGLGAYSSLHNLGLFMPAFAENLISHLLSLSLWLLWVHNH